MLFPIFTRIDLCSGVFILFFFAHPFVPSPGCPVLSTGTKVYLVLLALFSALSFLAQLCYVIILYLWEELRNELTCESYLEKLLRQIGFANIYHAKLFHFVIILVPNLLVFLSVIIAFLFQSVCRRRPTLTYVNGTESERKKILNLRQKNEERGRYEFLIYLKPVAYFLSIVSLIAAASCFPSLLSLVYLLGFLALGTLRALHVPFDRFMPALSAVLTFISAIHFLAIYFYQFEFAREILGSSNKWLLLIGISDPVFYTCSNSTDYDPLSIMNVTFYKNQFINDFQPLFVLMLFYTMAERCNFYHLVSKYKDIFETRSENQKRRAKDPAQHIFKPGSLLHKILVRTNFLTMCGYIIDQILANSYLLSVAVMILWSILCHGFLALVLLFIAIYLWSRTDSSFRTKNFAPFLCIYCSVYIIIQHVFNFRVRDEIVPDLFYIGLWKLTLEDIRLTTDFPMTFYIGCQCLGLIAFWQLLHTFMEARYGRKRDPQNFNQERRLGAVEVTINQTLEESMKSGRRSTLAALTISVQAKKRQLKETLAAVWMCFCIITLILICTVSETNYYNIVYMVFYLVFSGFTIFKLMLQKKVPDFEKFLKLLLFYSMVVFLAFYALNFSFLYNNRHIEKFLTDNELSPSFANVIPIAILLIAIKIQFDFFSSDFRSFMQELATGSARPKSIDEVTKETSNENVKLAVKIQRFFGQLVELVWLTLAIHMDKIILIALMGTILNERSAFNFILLIGFCCLCQFSSQFQKFAQNVVFIGCCSIIILRMLYGTSLNNLVNKTHLANCSVSDENNSTDIFPWTKSFYLWVGLDMKNVDSADYNDDAVPLDYLWTYLIVISLGTVYSLFETRCTLNKAAR